MRLKGRVALIKGSSRGIRKAIALRMAEEGAIIGLNSQSIAATRKWDGMSQRSTLGVGR